MVERVELEIDGVLKKVVNKHPQLFRGQVPPVYSWVEPGWYGIVDELCADISVLLANEPDVALDVLQVKEKLGGLRFYFRLRRVSGAYPDASRARARATKRA
jgi:hypothetical protein